jgi:hypothetical protein
MGLGGRVSLEGLLADDTVTAVRALGRREPGVSHPYLTPHVVSFKALPPLPSVDEVHLALGLLVMRPFAEGELLRCQPEPREVELLAPFGLRNWAQALPQRTAIRETQGPKVSRITYSYDLDTFQKRKALT